MFSFITSNLLWTAGWPIAVVLGVLFLISAFFKPLLFLVIPFFAFSFYFFRNPERQCLDYAHDKNVFICPADGKVVDVAYDPNNGFEGYARRVSIFLSPLDVHVNWSPVAGVIKEINYRPGKFVVAFAPKSSEINERNDLVIECANGKTMVVRQIAGFIARRICWWVTPGQQIEAGQKYGMIRFGSRVDVLLPADVNVCVAVGERVYGGCTVLAKWSV